MTRFWGKWNISIDFLNYFSVLVSWFLNCHHIEKCLGRANNKLFNYKTEHIFNQTRWAIQKTSFPIFDFFSEQSMKIFQHSSKMKIGMNFYQKCKLAKKMNKFLGENLCSQLLLIWVFYNFTISKTLFLLQLLLSRQNIIYSVANSKKCTLYYFDFKII
jgi:hypothetical protein